MCVQTIYWQDFTLDFREIRWTFGRAWDWTNFCEFHEKFVRFGNSALLFVCIYHFYMPTYLLLWENWLKFVNESNDNIETFFDKLS